MIKTDQTRHGACVPVPEFERLQYYYGRNLTVADLQVEQQYFLDKLRLHNRCFHGTGIVCGLEVHPVLHEDECDGEDRARRELRRELDEVAVALRNLEQDAGPPSKELARLEAKQEYLRRSLEALPACEDDTPDMPLEVTIGCGWAIDCLGREIIVRAPHQVDLIQLLSLADRRALRQQAEAPKADDSILELRICYCEQPTYPTRPMVMDSCALVDACKYARVREGYRLELSLTHQAEDRGCGSCCDPCEHECLVLAHVRWPRDGSLTPEHIDWAPRRSVSVYPAAVIEGVSWRHGATYNQFGAKQVLGTDDKSGGIEVHFSRPVYAESLQPGTVGLYCEHGGKGLAGVISRIEGSFVDKPDAGLITSFKYRDASGETLNPGDRVLIVIRGNFILDECCHPLDGEHVGGLVPQLAAYVGKPEPVRTQPVPPCASRPQPWVSGNGRPGATFESWFFVEQGWEKNK